MHISELYNQIQQYQLYHSPENTNTEQPHGTLFFLSSWFRTLYHTIKSSTQKPFIEQKGYITQAVPNKGAGLNYDCN